MSQIQIAEILNAAKRAKESHDRMRKASDRDYAYQGRGAKRATICTAASNACAAHEQAVRYLEELCRRAVHEGISFHIHP